MWSTGPRKVIGASRSGIPVKDSGHCRPHFWDCIAWPQPRQERGAGGRFRRLVVFLRLPVTPVRWAAILDYLYKATMKNKEFECIQCGGVADINMSQCPKCGLDFYPKEKQLQDDTEPNENEPDDITHTSVSNRLYAPWIHETETSLILTLAVSRRIRWSDTILLNFFLMLVLFKAGTAIIPFWGLLGGIIVSMVVIYNLVYQLVGREVIEVEQEYVTVRNGIWLWKRSRKYMANRIKGLRCTDTTYFRHMKQLFGRGAPPIWEKVLDTRTSAIVCEYDGQTVSLLGWIKKPLAKYFVSLVKRRFSIYRWAAG
jgi:hypothetical protein